MDTKDPPYAIPIDVIPVDESSHIKTKARQATSNKKKISSIVIGASLAAAAITAIIVIPVVVSNTNGNNTDENNLNENNLNGNSNSQSIMTTETIKVSCNEY